MEPELYTTLLGISLLAIVFDLAIKEAPKLCGVGSCTVHPIIELPLDETDKAHGLV